MKSITFMICIIGSLLIMGCTATVLILSSKNSFKLHQDDVSPIEEVAFLVTDRPTNLHMVNSDEAFEKAGVELSTWLDSEMGGVTVYELIPGKYKFRFTFSDTALGSTEGAVTVVSDLVAGYTYLAYSEMVEKDNRMVTFKIKKIGANSDVIPDRTKLLYSLREDKIMPQEQQ